MLHACLQLGFQQRRQGSSLDAMRTKKQHAGVLHRSSQGSSLDWSGACLTRVPPLQID